MTREEAIQDLKDILEEATSDKDAVCYVTSEDAEALNMAIEALSADAEQGEWKHTITGQPYCSNCEYVFGEDEEFSPFWDYCPMCGAKIKGGDDE